MPLFIQLSHHSIVCLTLVSVTSGSASLHQLLEHGANLLRGETVQLRNGLGDVGNSESLTLGQSISNNLHQTRIFSLSRSGLTIAAVLVLLLMKQNLNLCANLGRNLAIIQNILKGTLVSHLLLVTHNINSFLCGRSLPYLFKEVGRVFSPSLLLYYIIFLLFCQAVF
jgi:hypothetical protein